MCLALFLISTSFHVLNLDGRPIHYKQGDARFYQTSAFVLGRFFSTLPMRAIEVVAFGIPLYWMVGLDRTARSFFLYIAVVVAFSFGLKMLYGIIAQLFPNKNNVLSFGTFLVLLFFLFSGFIVYPDTIPGYYEWLYWINPLSWAFRALLIIEFRSDKYQPFNYTSANGTTVQVPSIGFGALESRGFPTGNEWIGYAFAFLIPYAFLCCGVMSFVLHYVRIQPTKNAAERRKKKDTEEENDEGDNSKSDFNLPFTPVDLTFENLCYEVHASTGDEMLRLLNNVNGAFRAGRMCALMGSSGAGVR